MVADKAEMRRESIYKYHFKNVDAIIERIHLLIDEEIGNEFEKFITSGNTDLIHFFIHKMLPHMYENKEWLKLLYSTTLNSDWSDFLQKKYSPIVEVYLNNIRKNDILSNFFLSHLIVKEFLAIVSSWLIDSNPEPASLFQKKFLHVLHTSLYDLLGQKPLTKRYQD